MNYVVNTPTQLKLILVGYRKSNSMSQKDMAEKLNVSQQAYQALESNPQAVTFERLMKVLNVLGVKLYLSDTELNSSSETKQKQSSNVESPRVIFKPDERPKIAKVKTKNSPSGQVVKKLNKDSW